MKNHDLTIRHKMLSFGNALCAAQNNARPKSLFPFYEKLYTYISPMVFAKLPDSLCLKTALFQAMLPKKSTYLF